MSRHVTPIEISNMPDLLHLVEEVATTKKPRELRRDNKPVALITPITQNKVPGSHRSETTGEALLRLAKLGEKLHIKVPADLSSRIDDYLYGEE